MYTLRKFLLWTVVNLSNDSQIWRLGCTFIKTIVLRTASETLLGWISAVGLGNISEEKWPDGFVSSSHLALSVWIKRTNASQNREITFYIFYSYCSCLHRTHPDNRICHHKRILWEHIVVHIEIHLCYISVIPQMDNAATKSFLKQKYGKQKLTFWSQYCSSLPWWHSVPPLHTKWWSDEIQP